MLRGVSVCACRMQLVQSGKTIEKRNVELPRHVEHVSSLANPYVKHLVKIRDDSSYRQAAGSMLVLGSTLLRELCEYAVTNNTEQFQLDMLLVQESFTAPADLSTCSQRTVTVTANVMQKLSGVKSSEAVDVVGVVPFPPRFCKLDVDEDWPSARASLSQWCSTPQRLLVLDGIQDPGNLGTLIRTATAFAWDGVFLLPGCCDPFNDKTIRASRAANLRTPLAVGSWKHIHSFAKSNSMKLYAGSPEPVHYSKVKSPERLVEAVDPDIGLCLVLGSEGQGLSPAARRSCQHLTVPMPGEFESLNVAVVGGIFMFLLMKKYGQ